MRGLSRLIPQEIQDSLNANPVFQWIVAILVAFVGLSVIFLGFNGIKNRRIRGKHGLVIEGTPAQLLGGVYMLLGVLMAGVAVSMVFAS